MNESLSGTVSSQLTLHLRDRILAGTYAPGAPLLQDTIAAEFGVSKIPVREALVQLQGEGLVDIFAHRGFQVRPISGQELQEIFQLRIQIEPDAVAYGARKASAEDQLAAQAALERLSTAIAPDKLVKSGALNRAYHLSLIVERLQPLTGVLLGRLHTLGQRYIGIHLSEKGRVNRARREHNELFEAWRRRDAKAARRLAKAHIEETLVELVDHLKHL